MSRAVGIGFTVGNIAVASLTSYFLWELYGPAVVVQVVATLVIAAVGEHIVSGQGYYQYTRKNGVFLGRVALWIPFMWVAAVQTSMVISIVFGATGLVAATGAGLFSMIVDMVIVEPLFSRQRRFWVWESVENGYFSFIPKELDRFTAPPGNYVAWFLFPWLMNVLLVLISAV